MTLDLSGLATDFLVWDAPEPISYEVARRAGSLVDSVPLAKRRAVTGREKSPSGGSYVGYEVRWLLPAALLTAGLIPKPADVVIDQSGTRWTVLTVQLGRLGNTWLLGTVDLVLALDLRDTIDIERATLTYDAAGVAVKSFPPQGGQVVYQQIPARVQLLTDEVKDQRGLRGFVGNTAVTVDRQLTVTNEDRVKLADGSYLDIVGYHDSQQIDQLPTIDCEKRP